MIKILLALTLSFSAYAADESCEVPLKKIPAASKREFMEAMKSKNPAPYRMAMHAKHGPLFQIVFVPTWMKMGLSVGRYLPSWMGGDKLAKMYQAATEFAPVHMFLSDGKLFREMVLQQDKFNRKIYKMSGLELTLGPESIFMLEDANSAEAAEWELLHDAMIEKFTRRDVPALYHDLILGQFQRVWFRHATLQSEFSPTDFANEITGSIVYRLLFGEQPQYPEFQDIQRMLYTAWGPSPDDIGESGKTQVREVLESLVAQIGERVLTNHPESFYAHMKRVQEEQGKSQSWLIDQVMTIYLAGQETTRVAVSYGLYYLARFPEMQERYLNDEPGFREAFVREVTRVQPPAPMIMRMTSEEVRLGPYLIPKDTPISVYFPYAQNNEADWGADFAEFKPERQLEPSKEKPLRQCPFGFGKRVCIGQHLATYEIKTIFAEILREKKLELLTDEPPQRELDRMGPRPIVTSYKLKFSPR